MRMVSAPVRFSESGIKIDIQRMQPDQMIRTFEAFYVEHLPKIYNFVRFRVVDKVLAEDLTSQIMERALTRLHLYQSDKGSFSTWIFAIAHNIIADHFRDQQREAQSVSWDDLADVATAAHTPEEEVMRAELLRNVYACVRLLPPQQRDVLALHFSGGLSAQEVAHVLGLTPNHVAVLLHRAIKNVRAGVEEARVKDS